jgi:hypothetical protein
MWSNLGRKFVKELSQSNSSVELVFIESTDQTFDFQVKTEISSLPISGRFIWITVEVSSYLRHRQEATLKPIQLIKNASQGIC